MLKVEIFKNGDLLSCGRQKRKKTTIFFPAIFGLISHPNDKKQSILEGFDNDNLTSRITFESCFSKITILELKHMDENEFGTRFQSTHQDILNTK